MQNIYNNTKIFGHIYSRFRVNSISLLFTGCIVMLCIIGGASLYSALHHNNPGLFWKQTQLYCLFLALALILSCINIKIIYKSANLIYLATLSLLIISEIIGHKAMGAQRWLRLGHLNLQPSEFIKIGLTMAIAAHYHKLHYSQAAKIQSAFIPLILGLIPAFFIYKQPNLGTSIITIAITLYGLLVAGLAWQFFALLTGLAIGLFPLLWLFLLHDYQKQRILTFLHPENDIFGSGYNIMQSKIAIGSGGLSGKGFLAGTQSQLNFLPEKHTDFVFTLFAEEWGFIGVIFVYLLCFAIIVLGNIMALQAHSHFARILGTVLMANFFLQIGINTCMISGLIPVVGIPFPLLSYGGSNLAATLCSLGLVLNIYNNQTTKLKRH